LFLSEQQSRSYDGGCYDKSLSVIRVFCLFCVLRQTLS
jgi:hypothetical protein